MARLACKAVSSSSIQYPLKWESTNITSITPLSQLHVEHRHKQDSAFQICPGSANYIHSRFYPFVLKPDISALVSTNSPWQHAKFHLSALFYQFLFYMAVSPVGQKKPPFRHLLRHTGRGILSLWAIVQAPVSTRVSIIQ